MRRRRCRESACTVASRGSSCDRSAAPRLRSATTARMQTSLQHAGGGAAQLQASTARRPGPASRPLRVRVQAATQHVAGIRQEAVEAGGGCPRVRFVRRKRVCACACVRACVPGGVCLRRQHAATRQPLAASTGPPAAAGGRPHARAAANGCPRPAQIAARGACVRVAAATAA
jgi:hypothetical protein